MVEWCKQSCIWWCGDGCWVDGEGGVMEEEGYVKRTVSWLVIGTREVEAGRQEGGSDYEG